MALSVATNRNDYVGTALVSVYAYSFRIVSQSDLVVTVRDTDDVETTLTLTTDYTVSDVGISSGGNVTLVNASQSWLTAGKLKSGYILTIRRVVSLVQNTDIRNQGTFYPSTHENALDYLTMICQQQQDQLDRSVRLPVSILPAAFSPLLPADIADHPGAALLVNAAGDGFTFGTSLFSFTISATQPTNPGSTILAFWFDLNIYGMKVWCLTEWRQFA